MSDLSRLLEDVYASAPAAPPADASPPAEAPATEAPSWSSEDALEQVFSDWVPGPPEEAPSQERAMFASSEEIEAKAEDPVDWEAAIAALMPGPSEPVDQHDDDEYETETVPLVDDDHSGQSMAGAFELFESIIGDMPKPDPEPREGDDFLTPFETPFEAIEEDETPLVAAGAVPAPMGGAGWCRDDDDILPARSARRFRLTLRR